MFPATEQPVRPNLDIDGAATGSPVKGDGDVGEPETDEGIVAEGHEISMQEEDAEPRKVMRTPYTPIASERA